MHLLPARGITQKLADYSGTLPEEQTLLKRWFYLLGAVALLQGCGDPLQVAEDISNIDLSHGKATAKQTYDNMHGLQMVVESYATETGGVYPTTIDEAVFKKASSNTDCLMNPITHNLEQPQVGHISDVKAARNTFKTISVTPGGLQYCALGNNADSYAILGGAEDGKALTSAEAHGGDNHTLVLSNQ
jgi:hypothetical protein